MRKLCKFRIAAVVSPNGSAVTRSAGKWPVFVVFEIQSFDNIYSGQANNL
jgi:hypothetical protein